MSSDPGNISFNFTREDECPYLPDRKRRLLYTTLPNSGGDTIYAILSNLGFRRSGDVLYATQCGRCQACIHVRIRVRDFEPSRSQARVIRRNSALSRSLEPPVPSDQAFRLFKRYLDARHASGSMAMMEHEEFTEMFFTDRVRSMMVKYNPAQSRPEDDPVAICHTDILSDGLSMCYSYFDPDHARNSPGTFMILDHVAMARARCLDYVYLGSWVEQNPKMSYKTAFSALEYNFRGKWLDSLPS